MFHHAILGNADAAVAHCHCPSIALAPDGDVVVAWYAYPQEETRDGTMMFARRRAANGSFDPPTRILEHMRSSLGNPLLFFDHAGRLHLLFVVLRGQFWDSAVVNTCHSDDMGKTWSKPQTMRLETGMMLRHPPMSTASGQLVLPAYDEKSGRTVMLTSDPAATSWAPATRLNDMPAIQGSITESANSHWVMMLRPCGDERCCLRSVSSDEGRTWSPIMRTGLPNPCSGLAAFRIGDHLCTVYNHTRQHRRYPLSLAYSTDDGLSWSPPLHIDRAEHEVSYPQFVVDSNEAAHGVYTFGRTRIRYVCFDRSWWER